MNYYEDMAECKKCHKVKCEAGNMIPIQNHSHLKKKIDWWYKKKIGRCYKHFQCKLKKEKLLKPKFVMLDINMY